MKVSDGKGRSLELEPAGSSGESILKFRVYMATEFLSATGTVKFEAVNLQEFASGLRQMEAMESGWCQLKSFGDDFEGTFVMAKKGELSLTVKFSDSRSFVDQATVLFELDQKSLPELIEQFEALAR